MTLNAPTKIDPDTAYEMLGRVKRRMYAASAAEHVLPHFEDLYPDDHRPRRVVAIAKARWFPRAGALARASQSQAQADANYWRDRRHETIGAAASGQNQEPGHLSMTSQRAIYLAAMYAAQAAALACAVRTVGELKLCLESCRLAARYEAQRWENVTQFNVRASDHAQRQRQGSTAPEPRPAVVWPANRARLWADAYDAERAWQIAQLEALL